MCQGAYSRSRDGPVRTPGWEPRPDWPPIACLSPSLACPHTLSHRAGTFDGIPRVRFSFAFPKAAVWRQSGSQRSLALHAVAAVEGSLHFLAAPALCPWLG